MSKYYVSDFETTTKEENCHVWLAGIADVYSDYNYICNSIDEWFIYVSNHPGQYYFHNLRFDGSFIIPWLIKNNFEHTFDKVFKNQFKCMISEVNVWYKITIRFKNDNLVEILDSLKLAAMPLSKVAKAFNAPVPKGEIDYTKDRNIDYIPSTEEIEYLKTDLQITKCILPYYHQEKMFKMTQGANAFASLKNSLPDKYRNLFPIIDLKIDKEIRQAYKGGIAYVNPLYQNKDIEKCICFDRNSMYPTTMRYMPMPYGMPKIFQGKYRNNKGYPLYIQIFSCAFDLKPGHIPTIQIKSPRLGYNPTQYLTTSTTNNGNITTLALTSVDLNLFYENYDVTCEEWIGGYMFMASTELFKDYIDYWYGIKEKADKEGNQPLKTIAKIMLNSAYGKFATNPEFIQRYPIMENGVVKLVSRKIPGTNKTFIETREPEYTAVACFITAWSRYALVHAIQDNIDRFLYCDTDSVHLLDWTNPKLEIDQYKLGAWKQEGPKFTRARYLRAKTYWEENEELSKEYWKIMKNPIEWEKINNKKFDYKSDEIQNIKNKGLVIKCAGLPDNMHQYVTWDNFHFGLSLFGKLQHKTVENGAILVERPFNIT